MRIRIKNLQKIKRINSNKLTLCAASVLKYLKLNSKYISLVLCDNSAIKKLNRRFFKRNRATDVIAFPLSDELEPSYLGEVVISVQTAVANSKKFKTTWQEELLLYVIHGILHLAGWRDTSAQERTKMRKKEQQILKMLE